MTPQILYDRDEFKLIERVCQLRETNPDLKVGDIQRPYDTPGFNGDVYEVEVEF